MQHQPSKFGPTRRRPTGRQRNATPASRRTANPTAIGVAALTAADNFLTVQFDGPVMLCAIPQYKLPDGSLPTQASASGSQSVVLRYPAELSGGAMTIPFEDPAVRNATGGFVNAGTQTLPAAARLALSDDATPQPMKKAA